MSSKENENVICTVNSTAVVKKCLADVPARFMKLGSNTNLNDPPSNWLRMTAMPKGSGNRGETSWQWQYPKQNSSIFSSFSLASSFPDCIGEVDVISDAENIKKLLKIPFSKGHISMMVHRVGKTLLLDEFDIHSHLLRASQKQWEWLRKFYYDHVLETLNANEKCLRKNKSRGHLQNKNMLSKFLYYSLMESEETAKEDENLDPILTPCGSPIRSSSLPNSPVHRSPSFERTPPKVIEGEIPIDEEHEFLRNVLWTFEDIRMLIGSDLPIFGGGTHPVVSLRLRDMQKPINILTGLDYWLDNLMCNVPEVVMCYHLDGIVQKYELLKTEEIPQMAPSSQFSPKVVKDIAQNVLSFLKSKATKSGHTYWLFKGKNDDVVKLYDLTTILTAEDEEEESESFKDHKGKNSRNPFSLPVAALLYQVARNMKESKHGKPGTIFKLLSNCIALMDKNSLPQIEASAHYLLADLYFPSDQDPNVVHGSYPSDESDAETWPSEGEETDDDEEDVSFSMDVDSLWKSPSGSLGKEGMSDAKKAVAPLGTNWEDRCLRGLKEVSQGLLCLISVEEVPPDKKPQPKKDSKGNDGWTEFAHSSQSIPLPFTPLKEPEERKENKNLVTPGPTKKKMQKALCRALLYRKATQLYGALGEIACRQKEFGKALQCVKLGLACNEQALKSVNLCGSHEETIAHLLGLAGDVHVFVARNEAMCSEQSDSSLEAFKEEFCDYSRVNKSVLEIMENRLDSSYVWSYDWPTDLENALQLSLKCYQEAMSLFKSKTNSELYRSLLKRKANVCNELGIFYMNQGILIWNNTRTLNELVMMHLKNSQENLTSALQAFEETEDYINISLLNSNLGRLMRMFATASGHGTNASQLTEFTFKEKKFYQKAVVFYRRALEALDVGKVNQPQHREAIQWDLCTTLFMMGTELQDRAPLKTFSQEEIEKEIGEIMNQTLELCQIGESSPRQAVYQYRAATVHHRLASLYHNAYRNNLSGEKRRKQQKELSDKHYAISVEMFSSLGNANVFFNVLLEWIGLLEASLAGQTGAKSKIRSLQNILHRTLQCKPVLSTLLSQLKDEKCSSDDPEIEEEARETKRLLLLFHQRLKQLVESLVKSQKSYKGATEAYKQGWFKTVQLLNQDRQEIGDIVAQLLNTLAEIEICLHSLSV